MSDPLATLRDNRIAGAIDQIERGEEVDWKQLGLLQSLDVVNSGKQFLADAIEENDDADKRAAEFLRTLQKNKKKSSMGLVV